MTNAPLYKSVPKALKRFNYFHNLPRTIFSYMMVVLGLKRIKSDKKYTAITFSISEDYARVWLFFAKKFLPSDQWNFIIVDCSGDMRAQLFYGAKIIKYLNLPHGKKIDMFLRKIIDSEIIFLCDDDRYLIHDIFNAINDLKNENTA